MSSGFSLRVALLAAAATTAAVATPCCPFGWQRYQDKCYWVSDTITNGTSLVADCASLYSGAEPVSVHDISQGKFIAVDLTKGRWTWLGLYKPHADADWSWHDGTPVDYASWDVKDPNRHGEACGSVNYSHRGAWTDEACDQYPKLFACQVDALCTHNRTSDSPM